MDECQLCGLPEKEGYRVVHSDSLIVVAINIEPIKQGHLMVLPVRHVGDLSELSPIEAAALLATVDRCMKALCEISEEPPMCLVNGWKHRSQQHLHVHVLPSKEPLRGLFAASEGRDLRVRASEEELTRMADAIRSKYVSSR
jgi:ATP adenylyltransferase